MQASRKPNSSRSSSECAAALLESASSLLWYVRWHVRRHRKGLSIPQFRSLMKIQTQSEASLSCVADHLGASLPTASRIVANLVVRGYLTRQRSERDGRQIVLRPTERGRAIVNKAREASLTQMADELGAISKSDRAALIDALQMLTIFVSGVRQEKMGRQRDVIASRHGAPLPTRRANGGRSPPARGVPLEPAVDSRS